MQKKITEIIEEVKCEFCREFCKYAEECDKEIEEKGKVTRYCPLDKL